MPDHDQAVRLAAAAAYALDHGYQVTAVASSGVALRMVMDGHADVVVVATLDDLPEIEVAGTPRPPIPRQRTAPDVVPPDVVPPSRRRPRRRSRGCDT